MAKKSTTSYHSEDGLERAVIDLIRVGVSGYDSGVRQLAARIVRNVPTEVMDPIRFREAIHEAMAAGTRRSGLRFSRGELPTSDDGRQTLANVNPAPDGDGLVLPAETKAILEEVLTERIQADRLRRAGVAPTKSVLLHGPSGVGKTMAAGWIAHQTSVPLVTLDLATVTSSYLGSSGKNLRAILDYAKAQPSVLLLDEFDALAKKRDDDTDIGELKRVVSVILVELDNWTDTSLLVAATNHLHLLDPAVIRRFDQVAEFRLPNAEERREILEYLAGQMPPNNMNLLELAADATGGWTGAGLAALWKRAHRRAILANTPIDIELLRQLLPGHRGKSRTRDQLWMMASQCLHLSNREIAELAGVTHPTVGEGIRRARRPQHGSTKP